MSSTAQRSIVTQESEPTPELRHLEELLKQRTRELENANERLRHAERLALVGNLAAGIAHEINNPIGIITLAATNALEVSGEPNSDGLRDRALEKILKHCQRCREIVNSVRTFAGKEPAERTHCSLNRIMHSAVDLTSGYAKDRGISLELELADRMPEIELVPREMEQVFVNLIRGAIEVGQRGTRVQIQTEATGHAARGIIRDCESALAHKNREQCSESSDPLHSPAGDAAAGFNFATTHEIVVAHGGSIELANEADCLTEVVVTLPYDATSQKPCQGPGIRDVHS